MFRISSEVKSPWILAKVRGLGQPPSTIQWTGHLRRHHLLVTFLNQKMTSTVLLFLYMLMSRNNVERADKSKQQSDDETSKLVWATIWTKSWWQKNPLLRIFTAASTYFGRLSCLRRVVAAVKSAGKLFSTAELDNLEDFPSSCRQIWYFSKKIFAAPQISCCLQIYESKGCTREHSQSRPR